MKKSEPEKRVGLVCVGEALIDFTPYEGHHTYIMNFGGAPSNVAVNAARMGTAVSFIGKVGKDRFGTFLSDTFIEENIDISGLVWTDQACTTMTFVHIDEKGERSFDFVRKPGADMLLSPEDISKKIIEKSTILHLGAAQLCTDVGRKAIKKALQIARKAGVLVSFDPNFRPNQWDDIDLAKRRIINVVKKCDVLKVSEEEANWLTGKKNLASMSLDLQKYGADLVVISCGEFGAYYRTKNSSGMVEGYMRKAVDTTGAGDAFLGIILSFICANRNKKIEDYECSELENIIKFGNAAGAACVQFKGAIANRIDKKQLEHIMVAV